jgi:hypothetical protein
MPLFAARFSLAYCSLQHYDTARNRLENSRYLVVIFIVIVNSVYPLRLMSDVTVLVVAFVYSQLVFVAAHPVAHWINSKSTTTRNNDSNPMNRATIFTINFARLIIIIISS